MPKTNRDPAYVRLREEYSQQIVADITEYGSLWSISGNDVKQFPNEDDFPNEAAFVRDLVRKGVLEAASKAEYQELQAAAAKLSEVHHAQLGVRDFTDKAPIQEHNAQEVINAAQRKLAKRRARSASEGADEDEDFDSSEEEHSAGDEKKAGANK